MNKKRLTYKLVDEYDPSGEGDITLILEWEPLEGIDINDVLSIKVHNIWGEKATVPVLLNQMGLIKSDATRKLRLEELDSKTIYSELYGEYEEKLSTKEVNAKKELVDRLPPATKVEAAVRRDKRYIDSQKRCINYEKIVNDLDAIYWAIVAKIKQLNDFRSDLKPSELFNEIVAEKINGFTISKEEGRFSIKTNVEQ